MFSKFIQMLGGDPNKREVERLSEIVQKINALEDSFAALSDAELPLQTAAFKAHIAQAQQGLEEEADLQEAEQEALQELLPQAFALVREAAKRAIGQRHYDVQMIGGIVLHSGRIAEMRTGEGKTLVATLPVYLNALTGRGVHLITVNDYLARYQARWMAQIYGLLGLQVGLLQMASSTENGQKAYVVDFSKESTREDQRFLRLVERREAYAADITYGTNAEFGFDYLRDNMVYRYEDKVQRGHYFAIVDEVDNVLIDEARTPLIISGPAQGSLEEYKTFAALVRQLRPEEYEMDEKDRSISLTDAGYDHVEQLLGLPLRDPERPEDLTPEQARLQGYLEQALRAQYLYKRNKDYIVQGGKVVIVDEFTGRLMPGRRWSEGLHQAVEAKENVKVEPENITYATITLQNYFRMYQKLAGMTGTALTESEEFHKIYKLDVLPIPTNLEYLASRPDSPLVEIKTKDPQGYPIAYFAARADTPPTPRFWRRTDYPDKVYRTAESKLRAVVADILINHLTGRPVLVGTTSVENSERLSNRLGAEMLRRLAQVRLLRQAWFTFTQKEEDGRYYAELEPLYAPLETLEVATLRNFAKSVNQASLNPEEESNLQRLLDILELPAALKEPLRAALQAGIPRQVLNARKHTEESQIIAGAGALGAVTIATNMAGRGVDIKLGGELAEEITAAVNRLLKKSGIADPYDLSNEDRRAALLKIDPAEYGRYEAEARFYLEYFDNMEKVRDLGGLHVIGTERHESRRIDNQLRGRAARQGDPGSSRFYLSFEDDLLRMFGGEQARSLMERFQFDYDYPLEHRLVGNILESAQQRVEGNNFDVRKHLLEYDDVINAQRARIYAQRDRIFTKTDLTEDVLDLLKAEVAARISASAAEETPWRLISWLETAQPTFHAANGEIYPSYPSSLLMRSVDLTNLPASLLTLMENILEAEQEHQAESIETLLKVSRQNLQTRLQERRETLETALESQADSKEPARPQQILENLSALTQTPGLRLSSEEQRRLLQDPSSLAPALTQQIETALSAKTLTALLAAIKIRLGETPPGLEKLAQLPWEEAEDLLRQSLTDWLENQRQRLTGPKIQAEIEAALARPEFQHLEENPSALLRLIDGLTYGQRADFDEKTHKKVTRLFRRMNPIHLAARLAKGLPLEEEVLQHLLTGLEKLQAAWGQAQWITLGQNATTLADLGLQESAAIAPLSTPLKSLTPQQQAALQQKLGLQTINNFYRQILLKVISDLWVDYLTRIEALRVSIGLEAYAQRDPLVQYKGKASELFQNLLTEIRSVAASNLFAYRPANSLAQAATLGAEPDQEPEPALAPEAASSSSGRKRHKKKG